MLVRKINLVLEILTNSFESRVYTTLLCVYGWIYFLLFLFIKSLPLTLHCPGKIFKRLSPLSWKTLKKKIQVKRYCSGTYIFTQYVHRSNTIPRAMTIDFKSKSFTHHLKLNLKNENSHEIKILIKWMYQIIVKICCQCTSPLRMKFIRLLLVKELFPISVWLNADY